MKFEQIYQELRKKYSDEEIVDAMVIPEDLTPEEKAQSEKEIKAYRLERLRNMSEEDQILSDVMRLRFQMEAYVKGNQFSFERTFGKFLGEYLRVVRKTRKELSEDLAIHYTKLSRILNDKEEPNVELTYRLEKHSGCLIKALVWWKIMVKKQEFVIAMDEKTKSVEQGKVKNYLRAS